MIICEVLLRLNVRSRQNGMVKGKARFTVTLTAFPGTLHVPLPQADQVVVPGEPEVVAVSHEAEAVSLPESGNPWF